jgi:hypothetical protein
MTLTDVTSLQLAIGSHLGLQLANEATAALLMKAKPSSSIRVSSLLS